MLKDIQQKKADHGVTETKQQMTWRIKEKLQRDGRYLDARNSI
eukprot:COSAG02_NODE_5564_length_4225_cov_7.667071_4_plen_43_part_00